MAMARMVTPPNIQSAYRCTFPLWKYLRKPPLPRAPMPIPLTAPSTAFRSNQSTASPNLLASHAAPFTEPSRIFWFVQYVAPDGWEDTGRTTPAMYRSAMQDLRCNTPEDGPGAREVPRTPP